MKNTEYIGMLLKQINDNLGKRANNELRKSGLTISQIRYLGFMYENGKERTPFKLLEKEFDVAQPTVAGIMRRLEKKGLVGTLPNEEEQPRKGCVSYAEREKDLRERKEAQKRDGIHADGRPFGAGMQRAPQDADYTAGFRQAGMMPVFLPKSIAHY